MPTTPETSEPPGTERKRDEQREVDTPRYHGGSWKKADRESPLEPAPEQQRAGRAEGRPENGGDRDGRGHAGTHGGPKK